MEQQLRNNLLNLQAAFSEATGFSASKIGKLAMRDTRFFGRIQTHSFTVRTYDFLVTWFSKNWPEDARWPHAIDRPSEVHLADSLRQMDDAHLGRFLP